MANKLRDRLKRIKQTQLEEKALPKTESGDTSSVSVLPPEWESVGYKTLRRTVCIKFDLPEKSSAPFPPALAILVPDLFKYGFPYADDQRRRDLGLGDLVFFDLETTGLGGAGAVAFLAAFGRFKKNGLEISQYLLLDFPGESDFIEAVLKEFSSSGLNGRLPLIVSYNGKSFDSQFLKTRCLINGFAPPEYYHADLLHPCRRLWKNVLDDCSQSSIETQILGLDRTGDIPGSLAPDIWFSFLKNGETADLLGICEHNVKDIHGLTNIFFALTEIAASPLECRVKFKFCIEAIALRWRESLRRRPSFFSGTEACIEKALMRAAAKENKVKVLRVLAIEAEWKNGDFVKALEFAEKILAVEDIPSGLREETLRRQKRLVHKVP